MSTCNYYGRVMDADTGRPADWCSKVRFYQNSTFYFETNIWFGNDWQGNPLPPECLGHYEFMSIISNTYNCFIRVIANDNVVWESAKFKTAPGETFNEYNIEVTRPVISTYTVQFDPDAMFASVEEAFASTTFTSNPGSHSGTFNPSNNTFTFDNIDRGVCGNFTITSTGTYTQFSQLVVSDNDIPYGVALPQTNMRISPNDSFITGRVYNKLNNWPVRNIEIAVTNNQIYQNVSTDVSNWSGMYGFWAPYESCPQMKLSSTTGYGNNGFKFSTKYYVLSPVVNSSYTKDLYVTPTPVGTGKYKTSPQTGSTDDWFSATSVPKLVDCNWEDVETTSMNTIFTEFTDTFDNTEGLQIITTSNSAANQAWFNNSSVWMKTSSNLSIDHYYLIRPLLSKYIQVAETSSGTYYRYVFKFQSTTGDMKRVMVGPETTSYTISNVGQVLPVTPLFMIS